MRGHVELAPGFSDSGYGLMFARAPVMRREPSLAIPRACQAACSLCDNTLLEPPNLLEPGLAL